jgi:hypothetical protein
MCGTAYLLAVVGIGCDRGQGVRQWRVTAAGFAGRRPSLPSEADFAGFGGLPVDLDEVDLHVSATRPKRVSGVARTPARCHRAGVSRASVGIVSMQAHSRAISCLTQVHALQ